MSGRAYKELSKIYLILADLSLQQRLILMKTDEIINSHIE